MTIDGPVAGTLRARLEQAFPAQRIEVINDSDNHIGHAGHDGSGESHFTVVVVTDAFEGLAGPARHRMVFDAVGDLMNKPIHALSIKALTLAEANPRMQNKIAK